MSLRETSCMWSLKGLRGSFSEVNCCWLGFSNRPGAFQICHWVQQVQASFDPSGCLLGLWGTPNAFEKVVCDQFGADIPFVSSWVCSTFAAFRNRAHFSSMGVGLCGSLYKERDAVSSVCQRLSCMVCPIAASPSPATLPATGCRGGVSLTPQTKRGLVPVTQHLRSPKGRQHQPCSLYPSGEGTGELFQRDTGRLLPCFDPSQ